jgi:hypothetical protein
MTRLFQTKREWEEAETVEAALSDVSNETLEA